MCVETVRPTVIKHELKTHRGQDMAAHSGCIRALSSITGQLQTRYIQTDHFHSSKWRQDIVEPWVPSISGNITLHSQRHLSRYRSSLYSPLVWLWCYKTCCCLASPFCDWLAGVVKTWLLCPQYAFCPKCLSSVIQSVFQTQLSDSSLFCSCQCQSSCSLLNLTTASGRSLSVWLCSSFFFFCFRPRGGRAVAQGDFATQQEPD